MTFKRELSEEEEQDVLKLKEQGMKVTEIAKQFLVSKGTIYRILKRVGYKMNYNHGLPTLIIEGYYLGIGPKKLAEYYGVERSYVKELIWGSVSKRAYKAVHDEAKRNSDWFKSKQRNTVEQQSQDHT